MLVRQELYGLSHVCYQHLFVIFQARGKLSRVEECEVRELSTFFFFQAKKQSKTMSPFCLPRAGRDLGRVSLSRSSTFVGWKVLDTELLGRMDVVENHSCACAEKFRVSYGGGICFL